MHLALNILHQLVIIILIILYVRDVSFFFVFKQTLFKAKLRE